MNWQLNPESKAVNLYVKGRIDRNDAKRQQRTVSAILKRLHNQPGLILADEVGMGKTFVALAVAVLVHWHDSKKNPVIVMVPSSLKEKWPRDFEVFQKNCLDEGIREQFLYGRAERAVDLLKFLDDPPERRKAIVFMNHGAMSRGLMNGWVKLALIQKTLENHNDTDDKSRVLCRFLGDLLRMGWVEKSNDKIWSILLDSPTDKWLGILHQYGIDPEHDNDPYTDDDPVPEALNKTLEKIDTRPIFEALSIIPLRKSKNYNERITHARRVLNKTLRTIWQDCLRNLSIKLPLLIMDEAHHLKNSRTRLASLFKSHESHDDAEHIQNYLAGVFERMLFLTATPFQLGHSELCNVLERFNGVDWDSAFAPSTGKDGFKNELLKLKTVLDRSQVSALNLDRAWGRICPEDLSVGGVTYEDSEKWWQNVSKNEENASEKTRIVFKQFAQTKAVMKQAERLLKKWVIRHNKPSDFKVKDESVPRRQRYIGNQIGMDGEESQKGIPIQNEALLPFLLSTRLTALTPQSRPVFAEGLASSYEAFLFTRRNLRQGTDQSLTDLDDDEIKIPPIPGNVEWYLHQLESVVSIKDKERSLNHPKIKRTVETTIDLWDSGEKVLVFCHYIATGKVLRQLISRELNRFVLETGSRKLRCSQAEVLDELEKTGELFFKDTRIRRAVDSEVRRMLRKFRKLKENHSDILEIVRRYLRTPSFLVRFFPLGANHLDEKSMLRALDTEHRSGLTLRKILLDFFTFLQKKCEQKERLAYIQALQGIQSGSIRGKDVQASLDQEEAGQQDSEMLMPNVRLVNGSTKQSTRQKLMLTFNTPFYPDILIASSVMAEGVDLHLNCRHIIHHDLCWNPSTLEQRTGRIDRIGGKFEACGKPIQVYIPFISETQDEKMYRVVMDRERWFQVLMGEEYKLDVQTTDKLAERIPLPQSMVEELSFKLNVF